MTEKRNAGKKADRSPMPHDTQAIGDQDAVIAGLNERIAALEKELQNTREELRVRQEEMETQAGMLDAHFTELSATNEALEREVRVREKSGEALRKSQFILARSQEMAHVGNWAWDLQTGEMKWSDESFRIFGYMPHEVRVGREWLATRIHEADHGLLTCLSDAVYAGKRHDVDLRARIPDGSVRYVNVLADRIVRDKEGRIRHAYGIFQDVTDRKNAEKALQEKAEEITVQAEELESQNEELRANYEELQEVTRSLEESEARFSAIYEHAAVGINMLGLDGRYLKVNHKFCDMTGYTREELLNLTFRDVYAAEDLAREENDHQRLLAGEIDAYTSEIRCLRKDGGIVWVNTSCSPIKADGKPIYLIRVIQDISERKQAEKAVQEKMEEIEVQAEELEVQNEEIRNNYAELQAVTKSLHESEALLRDVTDTSPDLIYIKDLRSRMVLANPATLRVMGKHPEEVIGKSDLEIYSDPAIGEAILANDRKIMESGRTETFEEVALTPYGYRTFLSTKTPFRNARGEITGIMGISRDITERKQAEEQLRKQAALIDLSPDGIIVRRLNGEITFWSEGAETMYGWTKEEAVGEQTHALLETGFPKPLSEIISDLRLTGRWSGELVQRKRGGEQITVQSWWLPAFDDLGNVVEILESNVDITERKQAEEELKEAKALAELYLDLMGHDISNMHQIALTQLELAQEVMLEDGRLEGDDIEMISTPIETLERSARLIDNVRKLQKLRAGEYRTEIVDICMLLSEVVRELSVDCDGITINYAPAQGCLTEANPLIKEAFTNLVGNAIKHSNGASVINIEVSRVSDEGCQYHRIAIDDTGPGIPDDKKEEIFHRFKRGQTKARGTGLGLYIVKTLVEGFNGRIEVEDRITGDYTRGSKFIVYLPIVKDLHE